MVRIGQTVQRVVRVGIEPAGTRLQFPRTTLLRDIARVLGRGGLRVVILQAQPQNRSERSHKLIVERVPRDLLETVAFASKPPLKVIRIAADDIRRRDARASQTPQSVVGLLRNSVGNTIDKDRFARLTTAGVVRIGIAYRQRISTRNHILLVTKQHVTPVVVTIARAKKVVIGRGLDDLNNAAASIVVVCPER